MRRGTKDVEKVVEKFWHCQNNLSTALPGTKDVEKVVEKIIRSSTKSKALPDQLKHCPSRNKGCRKSGGKVVEVDDDDGDGGDGNDNGKGEGKGGGGGGGGNDDGKGEGKGGGGCDADGSDVKSNVQSKDRHCTRAEQQNKHALCKALHKGQAAEQLSKGALHKGRAAKQTCIVQGPAQRASS